jgi:hypothetical protein
MAVKSYVDEGRVIVGAYIAPELKRSLVEIAFNDQTRLSDVIRDALSSHVAARRTGVGISAQ